MTAMTLFPIAGILTLSGAYLVWARVLNLPAPGGDKNEPLLTAALVLAVILTLLGLWELAPITSRSLHFSLPDAAAIATLLVQLMYLIGLWRYRIHGLGLFLLPITALPLLLMPLLPDDSTTGLVSTSSVLETGHLIISMLAYAVLTMAAFYAVMLLLLNKALKRKYIHPVIQAMPSLLELESMMITLLRWSVWMIGISILTGLSWQWMEFSHFALFNHKVLLALFSFGVLSWLLFRHKKAAWHGRRASQLVLTAYVLLLLAYFGVRLIHSWVTG